MGQQTKSVKRFVEFWSEEEQGHKPDEKVAEALRLLSSEEVILAIET